MPKQKNLLMIQVGLSPNIYEALDKIAADRKCTKAAVARQALCRWLDNPETQELLASLSNPQE